MLGNIDAAAVFDAGSGCVVDGGDGMRVCVDGGVCVVMDCVC